MEVQADFNLDDSMNGSMYGIDDDEVLSII